MSHGIWNGARWALICATMLVALVLPAHAGAVTILLGPPDLSASDPFATCDALAAEPCTAKTFIPTSLPEPGAALVMPADGTITSWRVRGAPPAKLRLRVVKQAANGQFTGVASSGVAKVSDGKTANTVAIGIGVGNQLGVNLENVPVYSIPSSLLGNSNASGAAWSAYFPGLADEATAAPTSTGTGAEPLFNATAVLSKPLFFNMTSTSGPETGGDVVVINGTHLAVATSVTFGGVPAQVISATNNQVMVAAPPHAPGPVGVSLRTAGGANDDSLANRYTYAAVPPPPPDTTAPKISSLSIAPSSFRTKTGATISFKSSEEAMLHITFERKPAGNRGPFKAIPGSIVSAATIGKNGLRFDARLNGRVLKAGRYRLIAIATDAVGNRAKAQRRVFKVLP